MCVFSGGGHDVCLIKCYCYVARRGRGHFHDIQRPTWGRSNQEVEHDNVLREVGCVYRERM